MKRIPTQRTTTRVAALEPPIQAAPVKHVPTRSTPLTWQLLLRTNHAVADTALGLPLQCGRHVLSPSHQSLDKTPSIAFVREVNDALSGDEP